MRITRAGYVRPRPVWRRNWLDWMCTTALVSFAGMFVAGAHDTFRWIS